MTQNGVCSHVTHLYDPEILHQLDWDSKRSEFKGDVSPTNPGENLHMRPLMLNDYEKGYMELISELTTCGEVSKEQFEDRFHEMSSCPGTYYVTVIEDLSRNAVIGTTSTIIEQKFIHSTSKRGRIEDVVVNSDYRGKQLGKLLVETGTLIGKFVGCYKMSLECAEHNIKFYQGFGYSTANDTYMVQRYKE